MHNEQPVKPHSFAEYAAAAADTAVYPDRGANLPYAVLGLVEEIGELAEKVHERAERHEIAAEAGDVYWYLAAICHEAGIPPAGVDLLRYRVGSLAQIPEMMLRTAAVVVCGCAKKAIRDTGGVLPDVKRPAVAGAVSTLLHLLSCVAAEIRYAPEQVWEYNLQKLQSRKQRGTLHGSGDNR